jgi:hypothetical protein
MEAVQWWFGYVGVFIGDSYNPKRVTMEVKMLHIGKYLGVFLSPWCTGIML